MVPDSFIIWEQTKYIKALSFNMPYVCFIWVAINVTGAYAYAWIEILMPDLLISTHELWQVTREFVYVSLHVNYILSYHSSTSFNMTRLFIYTAPFLL